ncbi:hypothetical protein [Streptomyces sp. NBC_01314]|uniref:hypothetical protein n=1 Tax=Streptomyces sp. NBC_01314 TaxID=2903821 RepID=UPI003084743C|nr:hypothetical protein OG622_02050 [Streptomyces sp. NBC_01314]
MRARTALLLVAAISLTATAASAVLTGRRLGADHLPARESALPRPRPNCPDCKDAGGWWSEGLYPGDEMCWCWDRPVRTLRLLPVHDPWPDEPPF